MKKLIALIIVATFFLAIPIKPTNADEMHFKFTFEKPSIIHQKNETTIYVRGCSNYSIDGMLLPVKALHILIPPEKNVDKIIVRGKKNYIGSFFVKHEQPLIVGRKNLGGLTNYNVKTKPYKEVGIYGLRGYKILVMNIFPIIYEKGKIYYYKNINLEIKLKKGSISPLYRGFEKDKEWVKQYVDNPWIADSYPLKDNMQEYEYLIITNEKLKDAFQRLADYKESHGIKTKIETVKNIVSNPSYWNSTPLFNDTPAKIRNFIRYAYKNWGIEYVLLGGDGDKMNKSSDIIPPRYLYATCHGLPLGGDELEAYIPSDVYYACLDGNFNNDMDGKWGENASGNDAGTGDEADLYAEVWVGRACVDSIEEANNIINKTISYEESNDSNAIQILLLGEHLGFGGPAEWGGNHKDAVKKYIPSIYNITTMYDKNKYWDKNDLIPVLNRGCNIVNHDGHGWTTYGLKLHNSDLKRLNNTDFFFVYSQTCLAGSFDNWYPDDNYYEDDCFAEHLTTGKHGAFACVMNARYGLGRQDSIDSPGERYDLSFFKGLFQENIKEIGKANHYSKEDNVWRINENGMRWTYYETNLFGDPQVKIKEPSEKINITINIEKPRHGLYLFNFGPFLSFINKTICVGGITIKANVTSEPAGKITKVNFYVNDELKASYTTKPYEWKWNEKARGEYKISVEAYAENGKSEKVDTQLYIFNI